MQATRRPDDPATLESSTRAHGRLEAAGRAGALLVSLVGTTPVFTGCQFAVVGDEQLDDLHDTVQPRSGSSTSGGASGSSWDSGGSWSSGGSWDSGGSWNSGGSSGTASSSGSGGGSGDSSATTGSGGSTGSTGPGGSTTGGSGCSSDFDCPSVACNHCEIASGASTGECKPITGCAGKIVCSDGEEVDDCGASNQQCCSRCPNGAQCVDKCSFCVGTVRDTCDGAGVDENCAATYPGNVCSQNAESTVAVCVNPNGGPLQG